MTARSSWPEPYPGNDTITQKADAQCDRVFAAYVGITDPDSIYTWDNIFPTATDWSLGDRELVCLAYRPASNPSGGAPITGSIKGSAR